MVDDSIVIDPVDASLMEGSDARYFRGPDVVLVGFSLPYGEEEALCESREVDVDGDWFSGGPAGAGDKRVLSVIVDGEYSIRVVFDDVFFCDEGKLGDVLDSCDVFWCDACFFVFLLVQGDRKCIGDDVAECGVLVFFHFALVIVF